MKPSDRNNRRNIVGAKYDEVTDALIERWLGLEPPGFIVLTATLHLPLPHFPTLPEERHAAERKVRDIKWNPQRYLSESSRQLPEVRQLVSEKEKLMRTKPAGKSERKAWFHDLCRLTEQLRPYVAEEVAAAERDLEHRMREATANEALVRRDFAWCMFPEDVLKRFCQRLL